MAAACQLAAQQHTKYHQVLGVLLSNQVLGVTKYLVTPSTWLLSYSSAHYRTLHKPKPVTMPLMADTLYDISKIVLQGSTTLPLFCACFDNSYVHFSNHPHCMCITYICCCSNQQKYYVQAGAVTMNLHSAKSSCHTTLWQQSGWTISCS